ncbi:alpha/beta hydrolase family protein [Actinocorallia lasiicapitis]
MFGLGLVSVPSQAVADGFVAADHGSKIVEEKQVDARTVDLTVDTPLIQTSDPKIRLYLPDGWSKTTTKTWPVVYVYSGGPGTYIDWVTYTDLPATAKNSKAIVALVDGGKSQGFTDWYNGGKGGAPKWETFHTADVLQLIERNFHASTSRAVMGLSSGGQGAITYAARHPGLFKYAASYSGILHITKPGIPAMMLLTDYGAGEPTVPDPMAKWGNPLTDRMNWIDHDPYVKADGLRGTGLYISAGNGDQGPLDKGLVEQIGTSGFEGAQVYVLGSIGERLVGVTNEDFVAKLKLMGIPVTANLYGAGFHQWKYWDREYKKAWPLITSAIGA